MERVKIICSAVIAAVTTVIGKLDWLSFLYVTTMAIDYITGTIVAFKEKCWSSKKARSGLWEKAGSVVAVLVAVITDIMMDISMTQFGLSLPSNFKSFITPLVLVWYILTELGSIIENAGRMGAPIPAFLRNTISVLHKNVSEQETDNNSNQK